MDGVNKAIEAIQERNPGVWEDGDQAFVVCKDGIVIMSKNGDTLRVEVIASADPNIRMDIELNLLAKDQ